MKSRLIPEWKQQDAVVIAWPNDKTDWQHNLQEVLTFYKELAHEISDHQQLIVLYNETLPDLKVDKNITLINIPFNDTWTRDYIGLSVKNGIKTQLIDSGFNAWGNKFEYQLDNKVNSELDQKGIFKEALIPNKQFILEGGSIDVNENGVLLTTKKCLLNPNRNSNLNELTIENHLKNKFGIKKIIWLTHGEIPGDDTDAHIDTLARFCDNNTICYAQGASKELIAMEKELKGLPFDLIPLPLPTLVKKDQDLPATYVNFLITNEKVLCPIYEDKNDEIALKRLSKAFPTKKIVGINALSLIQQNGSLHCVTMQLAKGVLK